MACQSARELSVADIGIDKIIAEIANGQGLPESSNSSEPLERWLALTIKYLLDYNPYAEEGGGPLRPLSCPRLSQCNGEHGFAEYHLGFERDGSPIEPRLV
ncbi:hypothetical protein D3C87_1527700 [compost metagenome]